MKRDSHCQTDFFITPDKNTAGEMVESNEIYHLRINEPALKFA
jgi:hypothetical protein